MCSYSKAIKTKKMFIDIALDIDLHKIFKDYFDMGTE